MSKQNSDNLRIIIIDNDEQKILIEENNTEKARMILFEKRAERDIEEIHTVFPYSYTYSSLHKLPNKTDYARLMDNKKVELSAGEAFVLSHPDQAFQNYAVYKRALAKVLNALEVEE